MRRSYRVSLGFTLIELLIVISIIALLIGILMPSLAAARKTAAAVQCQSNLKNLMLAMTNYSTQANEFLPYTNSQSGETGATPKWTGAGWLYDRSKMLTKTVDPWMPTSPIKAMQEDVQTGAIYYYVESVKVYHCPLDKNIWTPSELNSVRPLTSYTMNRAMNGWNVTLDWGKPAFRNFDFKRQDAVALWEADEETINEVTQTVVGDWNDGNNDPTQPVSMRHNQGGTIGRVDGSAAQISRFEYEVLLGNEFRPGPLWCNPLTEDGKSPASLTAQP